MKSGELRSVPAHNLILGWRSCRDESPSLHVSECLNVSLSHAHPFARLVFLYYFLFVPVRPFIACVTVFWELMSSMTCFADTLLVRLTFLVR